MSVTPVFSLVMYPPIPPGRVVKNVAKQSGVEGLRSFRNHSSVHVFRASQAPSMTRISLVEPLLMSEQTEIKVRLTEVILLMKDKLERILGVRGEYLP